ncbi:hypothetical protein [Aureitalea marina]|uniref:DUF3575 domain-containing protein n=1 Tax=Aureitalea marina TaxID=930804 RepID=A0A2S7KRA7_9FLAO|nr:hypothetical protein [Aureitalea marina]PQB05093.1 hypothetical protein BST85_09455 [Aureitalea marina]
MKSIKLFLLLGLITFCSFAQENDNSTSNDSAKIRQHEIRVDVLEGLLVPALDINYEYIFSKRSGAGLAVYIALDDLGGDYQQWAIAPYYRQYFFSKEEYGGKGFFVEGLLQVGGGSYEDIYLESSDTFSYQESNWTQFGIGFSFGQKWVSSNGFVAELSLGGGRYFGADNGPEAFFRGGALVGWRF